jgi:hypothetical protein
MKRFFFLGALPLAFVLSGCAGGDVPIVYSGTYSGTYTPTVAGGDSGTMDIRVDSLGSITGTVVDTTKNETTTTANGKLDNNGHLTLNAPFAAGADTFMGNTGFASNGHLTGTVTEAGAVNQQVVLDLTRM